MLFLLIFGFWIWNIFQVFRVLIVYLTKGFEFLMLRYQVLGILWMADSVGGCIGKICGEEISSMI